MTRVDPGHKPKLTRAALVAAALRIADAEGLDAVSMRRLGSELGVDATAAYRHLPNKKDLLAGVVEAVLDNADVETDPSDPWQEQFRTVARAYRGAMLAHSPAVARLVATTPMSSLSSLRIVEHGAAVLANAGVPLDAAALAIQAVGQITSGAVLLEAFWREHAAAGGQVYLYPPSLPHPDLPVLSAVVAAQAFQGPEDVFEFGVAALIEKLEALVA
jgi:TetR/AcrR family transcriptional regulator, tetracycline repressor protein